MSSRVPCPKCAAPSTVVRSVRNHDPKRVVGIDCQKCGFQESAEERVRQLEKAMDR